MSSLLEDTTLNSDQSEFIDIIKRSADSLFTIINDFLTMSSMKAGKLSLRLKPFSLNVLLADLALIFKRQVENKGVDFIIALDVGTPDMLIGDDTRIYQILQNLITNSIKFTNEGSIQVLVKVAQDHGEMKDLEFIVSDTGIGIPKEKQHTIFDSFTQAHTAGDRDYMGTGLGLNIVKALTHIMKGEVSLSSEESKGTKVSVILPLTVCAEGVECDLVQERELVIPSYWKNKKFLMIEDNIANIVYARELFRNWELDITFKETYEAGLEEANAQYYNLILSDLKLPDGNGINLLEEIRSNPNSASHSSKLAIITASILQSDRDRAAELDISSYIEKPFIPSKLLNEIHIILEGKSAKNDRIVIDSSNPKNALSEEAKYILNSLEKITNESSVQLEFIDIFLDQMDTDVSLLEKAIEDIDFLQIYKCAHKLKSTVKIFKLNEMSNLISTIESISSSEMDIESIRDYFQGFKVNAEIHSPAMLELKEKLEEKLLAV